MNRINNSSLANSQPNPSTNIVLQKLYSAYDTVAGLCTAIINFIYNIFKPISKSPSQDAESSSQDNVLQLEESIQKLHARFPSFFQTPPITKESGTEEIPLNDRKHLSSLSTDCAISTINALKNFLSQHDDFIMCKKGMPLDATRVMNATRKILTLITNLLPIPLLDMNITLNGINNMDFSTSTISALITPFSPIHIGTSITPHSEILISKVMVDHGSSQCENRLHDLPAEDMQVVVLGMGLTGKTLNVNIGNVDVASISERSIQFNLDPNFDGITL